MRGMTRRGDQLADRLRATAKPWELAAFAWVPAIAIAYSCWYELHAKRALEDFVIFRTASLRVLHGDSPFPPATLHGVAHFDKFVYPPSTALLFAPLAVLPVAVGQVAMFVLGLAAIVVAVRLFDVSDWRCYGLVLMSAPAVNSLALGAITSLLLLAVAVAWRYRSRARLTGATVALAAVSKLFLWPLGVWLLVTRRLRAVAALVVAAVALWLAGWAALGLSGMSSYPKLLHLLSQAEQSTSYSPIALLHVSDGTTTLLSLLLAALAVAGVVVAARGQDGDRRALAAAAVAAIVATPILWLHYFLLLVVPIALYRPRLSGLWFLPLLLWATPSTHAHGVTWHIVLALAITAVVAVRTLVPWRPQLRPLVLRAARSQT
jgi:alpha-1,2-mannosyltransferase